MQYTMTWEDVQQTIQRIETVAEQMTAPLAQITDQYTIIRYLLGFLIIATEYDSNTENNQNIQSVFLDGRSVWSKGYTKAMRSIYFRKKYLNLTWMDRPTGEKDMPQGSQHCMDGALLLSGPKPGEMTSYSKAGESTENVRIPTINYDYFLVTTQELEDTSTG